MPVQIGEVRVMLQYVPNTVKSQKEKCNDCYLKVWIRQASGLKTRYDNGTYVLWLVISCSYRHPTWIRSTANKNYP